MHCEDCVLEIANAVITRDPCDNEAPEPLGGGHQQQNCNQHLEKRGHGEHPSLKIKIS